MDHDCLFPAQIPDSQSLKNAERSVCRGEQAGWAAPHMGLGKGLGCSRPVLGAPATRHGSVLTPGQEENSRAHRGPPAFRIL